MNKKYICEAPLPSSGGFYFFRVGAAFCRAGKIGVLSILAAFCIACSAPYLYADDMEDNVERLYVADFETHPTSLGGKIHVYGSAILWNWQYPGDNFSWFYGPGIMPYDISNVHSGARSFRIINMRSSPNWASIGINLGPIMDPAAIPMKTASINVSGYDCLEFWVKGAGAKSVAVLIRDAHAIDYTPQIELTVPVSGGEWAYVAIPMPSIAAAADVTQLTHIGFDIGSLRGNGLGAGIFIDDVAFSRSKR